MTDSSAQLNRALAGRYVIEREVGEGGMATVYLARDVRHDRQVAVKVLKPELGAVLGAERFLSEIRVTANLQHPNLLPLFDSGEADGLLFYVMPFVDGETLRARLDRETQLPVDEAIRIAVAIANALDHAHGRGVIHRDLKPENILLQSGQPVIADFGIALAVSRAGGARVTQTGLSLGTPQYMSPEQATGDRTIDARSDVYSLGAVLYEMLTGEPPHSGPSAQAIIAKLMTTTPPSVRMLRPAVPERIAMAVDKAISKLPADRFGSAKEFCEALTNPSFATLESRSGAQPSTSRRRKVEVALAGLAAVLLATNIWTWTRPVAAPQVLRYTLDLDSGETLSSSASFGRIAISPDGRRLVYVGAPDNRLMLRERNELHARPIPGTEGASTPFFSPDGTRVGFITGSTLKIVDLKGTPPVVVTDSLVGLAGFSWGADGYIYSDGGGSSALVRVGAKPGARSELFGHLDTLRNETDEIYPEVLPNGKAVLFTATYSERGAARRHIAVADVATGTRHILLEDALRATYVSGGYLLYVTLTGALMVVPFDQDALRITGEAVAIDGSVGNQLGNNDVVVSRSGTLVYISSPSARQDAEPVWITRDGKVRAVDSTWSGPFTDPALSPDGRHLAFAALAGNGTALWIRQLDGGPSQKLTLEGGLNRYPAWSPDGRSVIYVSTAPGWRGLFSRKADGSSTPELTWRINDVFGPQWSHDGRWIVFMTAQGSDISGVRPGTDTVVVPLVVAKSNQSAPALSPDDRWLAYQSNESGRAEVYVVPFPGTSTAKWLVSTTGGREPQWSSTGKELFYRDGTGTLVAVSVTTKPTFSVGTHTRLFPTEAFVRGTILNQYVVAPGGNRFLFLRMLNADRPSRLTVVENWTEELKQLRRR